MDAVPAPTRRDLLGLIGAVAGGSAMYVAMSALGHAAESTYSGPIELSGDPKGASVLVLGAGVAGMVATMELRRAGYRVELLEYNSRPGGRTWTIRGGDSYAEALRELFELDPQAVDAVSGGELPLVAPDLAAMDFDKTE